MARPATASLLPLTLLALALAASWSPAVITWSLGVGLVALAISAALASSWLPVQRRR
jgi:hypothetical protein